MQFIYLPFQKGIIFNIILLAVTKMVKILRVDYNWGVFPYQSLRLTLKFFR
jgi:hypothetical protein